MLVSKLYNGVYFMFYIQIDLLLDPYLASSSLKMSFLVCCSVTGLHMPCQKLPVLLVKTEPVLHLSSAFWTQTPFSVLAETDTEHLVEVIHLFTRSRPRDLTVFQNDFPDDNNRGAMSELKSCQLRQRCWFFDGDKHNWGRWKCRGPSLSPSHS